VDEILNLKIKHLSNGNLTLEKVVQKVDKDRVSATIYGVWYIEKYMDNITIVDGDEVEELAKYIMW
jgi:ribonucleoside-diphosphate reductase alpha chain